MYLPPFNPWKLFMARNSGQNGGIWARAAVCGFLHNNRETNMAKSMASKKRSLPVDYTQLHSLSLVVLYDTSFKKSRGKLYDVERIIERRKTRYVSFSLYYLFHELLKGHFARIGLTWVSFAGLRRVCFATLTRVCFAALTRVYFPVLDGFILTVVFNGFSFSCLRRVYFAGLTRVYFS